MWLLLHVIFSRVEIKFTIVLSPILSQYHKLLWVVIIKILNDYYLMFITASLYYHCLFLLFIDFCVIISPFLFTMTWVSCTSLYFCVIKASDFLFLLNPWAPAELLFCNAACIAMFPSINCHFNPN